MTNNGQKLNDSDEPSLRPGSFSDNPDSKNENNDAEKNTAPPANSNQKRTKLHVILNELWGCRWPDENAFASIIKYADPEKVKKTGKGFELALLNGRGISWNPPTHNSPELISASKRGFDQSAAEAMVALARLRGWKDLSAGGTAEQKEMLWLAAQRQNLEDKEAFERGQKDGSIPKTGKDGKPLTYTPLAVKNFAPMLDSKVFQQWQQEEEAYKAAHPSQEPKSKDAEEKKDTKSKQKRAINGKFAAAAKKEPKVNKESIPLPAAAVPKTPAKPARKKTAGGLNK